MLTTPIVLDSGETVELNLSGNAFGRKQDISSFELVMHDRDRWGRILPTRRRVYRGDIAQHACSQMLKKMGENEKQGDVYGEYIGTEDEDERGEV